MGQIEAGARKKRRNRNLQRALLLAIGLAGMMAIGAIPAPQLFNQKRVDARLRYKAKSLLTRLKQKGEVEFVEQDGKAYARLTEYGEQVFAFMKEKMRLTSMKPKRWDKRYRLIMFDVPEKRKHTRDLLRKEVREAGFLRIQDSSWLYPYDCEEFVALLKANLHIGKDVLYAVVEEIEHDAWIRKHFNLPDER